MELRALLTQINIWLRTITDAQYDEVLREIIPNHLRNNDFLTENWGTEMPEIDGYEIVGRGNTRLVIRRKGHNWVLKIPVRAGGISDNCLEGKRYRINELPQVRKAKAKCVTVCKLPIVIMEWVNIDPVIQMPAWAYHVDSEQVGINRRGQIVAFDYGGVWH